MPPMARTARNAPAAPTMSALDGLDLDDMFRGGDDGLFDDIGMDIVGFDDITDAAPKKEINASRLDAVQLDLFGDIGVDDGVTNDDDEQPQLQPQLLQPAATASAAAAVVASAAAAAPTSPAETTKTRTRKNKRKSQKAVEASDVVSGDDDEPTKKKRRGAKKKGITTTKKSKAAAAAAAAAAADSSEPVVSSANAAVSAATITSTKTKTTKNAAKSTPPTNSVAAAGRFGGQHKRSHYPLAPKMASQKKQKYKSGSITPTSAATTAVAAVAAAAATPTGNTVVASAATTITTPVAESAFPMPQSQPPKRSRTSIIEKPLETLYCGLGPSDASFHPFLPTVPNEVSMKKCNKHYPNLEKIHSAVTATPASNLITPPAKEVPLFKLLLGQDPITSVQPDKHPALYTSILNSRKTAQEIDKVALLHDLQAIATLLKRQNDFISQSLQNMQRWCKTKFNAADYATVYGEPKSLLASFNVPVIRVRIQMESGWKESAARGPLLAQISVAKPAPTQKTKKRGSASVSASGSNTKSDSNTKSGNTSGSVENETAAVKVPLSFSELTATGRRQRLVEMISKRAQILEASSIEKKEQRRKAREKIEIASQKVVDEDDLVVINSMALWKWVEKAGVFQAISDQDIDELLQYELDYSSEEIALEEPTIRGKISTKLGKEDTLMNRLQSLLVEVDSGDEDDGEDDEDSLLAEWEDDEEEDEDPALVDLSNLSTEERCYLHLRSFGLLDESSRLHHIPKADEDDDESDNHEGLVEKPANTEDFDELLRAMKTDLVQTHRLNNARTAYLEASARVASALGKQQKQFQEESVQKISRYNQMMKKQKESKRSARQKVQKKDEDWLPW